MSCSCGGVFFATARRTTRRQELIVWHCPEVESMRKRLTFRAYMCLAIYTLVVAWINVCYVATYDAVAIRFGHKDE